MKRRNSVPISRFVDCGGGSAIEALMPHLGPSQPSVAGRWALLSSFAALLLAASLMLSGCQKKLEPLPSLGHVGTFSLLDQRGAPLGADNLRGKVWVAAFFFTRCPSICPRITRRMRALQISANSAAPGVSFVSFSVDPDNDTPPVLLAYAQRFGADPRNWSFLTGDLEVVKRTVVEGFKLALDGKADPAAENGGIIHGSHLVLVDKTLTIRGYYRSDDDDDMKRILEDAARL